MFDEDLTRPCDACGKFIGGGYSHCPECGIYFCLLCAIELQNKAKKFPPKCPMCGGEFI